MTFPEHMPIARVFARRKDAGHQIRRDINWRVVDVDTGKVLATFASAAAAGLAYSPNGSTLAVAGGAQGRVFLVGPLGTKPGPVRTNPN